MDQASAFSFDMSYCGPPVLPAALWSRWNFDPTLLVALLVIAGLGFILTRQAGPHRRLAFATAWLAAAALYVSPLCALTVSLFSARVGHHVVLTMFVAPLLAISIPRQWARRASLLPALALSTAALWLWHSPNLYTGAFLAPAIYWAMQLSLLGTFTLLWLALIHADAPFHAGLAALLSAVQMGMLGALLVFAGDPLYLPHFATTQAFGLSPQDDQHLGGLIMWVPANLPLLALMLWRLGNVLGPDREAAS
ncbi:cytochrome c oxidase assembly protein [Devosia sp.]|jgi:putative membrane protein|uniref:cytochrome c oxidase assembly protein n=1 Tax=Devosia sp. TaxID=1871048 RepID=UPI0025BF5F41|nr:cytochrome c oxidase assembly protein [Devosia sp.]